MSASRVSEEEFVKAWWRHQSVAGLARELGVDPRVIQSRRNRIEARTGMVLTVDDKRTNRPAVRTMPENQKRATLEIDDGVVIVGSDAHYATDYVSTAHRAFVLACKELKPAVIVLNGDSFDGAQAGRHGRIGWEKSLTVRQEIDACQDRLSEIEAVRGNAILHHTWGNHDLRFDTKLAAMVPEYEGVAGMSLKEHFPAWPFSMSLMINDACMVKHRWHSGIHSTWNNVLKSGMSIVTGHTHKGGIRRYNDYKGVRYGVDTGTMAPIDAEAFSYAEDAPKDWQSGLSVLTFKDGILLPPEQFEVIDEEAGKVFFRGQLLTV